MSGYLERKKVKNIGTTYTPPLKREVYFVHLISRGWVVSAHHDLTFGTEGLPKTNSVVVHLELDQLRRSLIHIIASGPLH